MTLCIIRRLCDVRLAVLSYMMNGLSSFFVGCRTCIHVDCKNLRLTELVETAKYSTCCKYGHANQTCPLRNGRGCAALLYCRSPCGALVQLFGQILAHAIIV